MEKGRLLYNQPCRGTVLGTIKALQLFVGACIILILCCSDCYIDYRNSKRRGTDCMESHVDNMTFGRKIDLEWSIVAR